MLTESQMKHLDECREGAIKPCRWCGEWTSEVSQLCRGVCQDEWLGETRAEHEDEESEEEGEEL
jgi:hypothetical protein